MLGRFGVDEAGGFTLRLDDVDEDEEEPVEALALVAGGPPWLVLPEPCVPTVTDAVVDGADDQDDAAQGGSAEPTPAAVPAPTVVTTSEAPAPRTALRDTQLQLAAERNRREAAEEEARDAARLSRDLGVEVEQLTFDLDAARRDVARLEHQVTDLKAKYRKADKQRQRAEADTSPDDTHLFADPVEQLRFEIGLMWARTVGPHEKAALPLARYTVGPRFVESIDTVAASREKVLQVIVQVLVGLAETVAGRQHHALRTGESGASPPRVRNDGARCYRVAVQVNAPSARRLHYWKLPDNSIELSRVVVHDDMEP